MDISEKVLKYFFENPYSEIYLRDLAKKLKISPFAAKKYCELFIKEDLIKEKRLANLRFFKANIDNIYFRYRKIAYSLKKIQFYKIIEVLKKQVSNLSSVVVYGSVAKGLDDENSDLDLVIIGNSKKIIYIDYEKEVNIKLFSWQEWKEQTKKNKAFYYDVIKDGIAIYGDLPIV